MKILDSDAVSNLSDTDLAAYEEDLAAHKRDIRDAQNVAASERIAREATRNLSPEVLARVKHLHVNGVSVSTGKVNAA